MNTVIIGQNIERIRKGKNLSREEFCGNEKELTVRQLGNIERGESNPSLTTLNIIAKKT